MESVSLKVLAARIPDPPQNVVNNVDITTNNEIGLQWSAGQFNGGSPILDYQVSIVQTQGSTIYLTGIETTSTVVSGLTKGSTYTLSVQARNAVGLSTGSEVTIQTLSLSVPSEPVLLKVEPAFTNATRIKFSWSEPTNDGGSPIIFYSIWSNIGDGNDF